MEGTHTPRELHDQSRVLVLESSGAAAANGPCVGSMAAERPAATHAVTIAYDRSPAAVVGDWQSAHGTLPASLAIIGPHDGDETLPEVVHVTGVAPDDLTGVGIAVGRYLDQWRDGPVVACLDSLTAALQHVEEDRLFRFLHTLMGRFVAAGASAHAHLDPSAVDDRTVATLGTLFDTVVRREDGGLSVEQS